MKNQDMGLGKLGGPFTVFVRKFRWTLKSENLSESSISSIKFDHIAKTINLVAIEAIIDGHINVHEWLDKDISKEELIFTTYDGCGRSLYEYKFTGLKLLEDKQDFDYSVSDVSARHIKISYDKKQQQQTRPKGEVKHVEPKASIAKKKIDKAIELLHKKNKNWEEIEINFLNTKLVIPAKFS